MTLRNSVLSNLPVRVEGFEAASDPVLSVHGKSSGWYLSVASPWRLEIPGGEISWDELRGIEACEALMGRELVDIEIDEDLVDPVFHFSGGVTWRIAADTDIDPWVLSIPGLGFTLVGVRR